MPVYIEGDDKFNEVVDFILKEATKEELALIKQLIIFKLNRSNLDIAAKSKFQKKLGDGMNEKRNT